MDSEANTNKEFSTTKEAIPVAPSMQPTLVGEQIFLERPLVDRRLLIISAIAVVVASVTSVVALVLVNLISFITNVAFYQRLSLHPIGPGENHLGLLVILVPVIGGVIVGLMARYGSKAIRGHGIPEAMEQVLCNGSIIPARLTFLKPISAAISIGTGGPFGAEGPIIASGGAFGSLIGQLFHTTAHERKTLLAAGAAAGMTAIFGSPVAAVILAIELLVFEYRPRSLLPICVAAACAGTLRLILFGSGAAFAMPEVGPPSLFGMLAYAVEGVIAGAFSIAVTKAVYWVEDEFEKLPVHWMWWPAIGGVAVGVVGYFFPLTMGVGYENIERILSGSLSAKAAALFCLMKFISWVISLGTGTSGGTLAPLFTIGGGVGLAYGALVNAWFPGTVNLSVAALVGMAAIFAGASRAMLASLVFAFETTRQSWALLPLLAGCNLSYIVSCLRMKNSIMTEKISRRGVAVPTEYGADPLQQIPVGAVVAKAVVAFLENEPIESVRKKLSSADPKFCHQGYPVVNDSGMAIGVFTRKDLDKSDRKTGLIKEIITRPAIALTTRASFAEARDMMVRREIGRLLVLDPKDGKPVGMITRRDVLRAYSLHLNSEEKVSLSFRARKVRVMGKSAT